VRPASTRSTNPASTRARWQRWLRPPLLPHAGA
jgi:hypothetical protein